MCMPFNKIGFFHFVRDHADPIAELRKALESLRVDECIRDSLVVLPEAFNIRKRYKERGAPNYDRCIVSEIQQLSNEFQATFVVGLIIEEPERKLDPPHNSAYLIDKTSHVLVSHKLTSDGNESNTPYTPCTGQCDPATPIVHSGIGLVAAICADIEDRRRVEKLLSQHPEMPTIICIPACMRGSFDCNAIARSWESHRVILANSDPDGIGSFVSMHGNILIHRQEDSTNKIVLTPWSIVSS